MVEHFLGKEEVIGSIPIVGSEYLTRVKTARQVRGFQAGVLEISKWEARRSDERYYSFGVWRLQAQELLHHQEQKKDHGTA